jgi:hypothetical protein
MDITIESFKPFVKHLQGIMLVCFFFVIGFFFVKNEMKI